jgi:CDP-paratose 2-epimerase
MTSILITGGCGFIGCNTAKRLLDMGQSVTLLDDLSRPGTDHNLAWLREQGDFAFAHEDVCAAGTVADVVKRGRFDVIIHLAAQVAVTTSVVNPRRDFEINALGTLNLLEAVRLHSPETVVLNASTNKVYGKLDGVEVNEEKRRYSLRDVIHGIGETQPLDFHSPYGCSKGAADQYVTDYARIYGLRTVNLRQSCIYGYRQFGVEDQGWVAWFTIAHLLGRPVTIYGTGKQVRDILFVDDLVDCYLAAIERIDRVAGRSFNIGGGPANTLSLLELLEMLDRLSGQPVEHDFADWRPGDQPVYISDIREAQALLGWNPKVGASQGVQSLYEWVAANRESVAGLVGRL